ncbi:MAG TPA: hypothetical protein VIS74_02990 [Chthoniobacterales bacterium]
MAYDSKKPLTPAVPRDFVTAPIFAATKQTEPRTIIVNGVRWIIGDEHPTKHEPSPAFDIRHGRACLTALSFRDRMQNGRDINFSMNEFCHRYAQSRGGRYSRDILDILFDLRETWVRRISPDGRIERFTIIGEIKIDERPIRRRDDARLLETQGELWLDRVSLSPEFFGLLQQWETLAKIRLDVLNGLTSPTAQAIYTFLPSRAVHHDEGQPFAIRLTNLLEQISAPVSPHKSVRKRLFTQNTHSILSQLDGAQIMNGTLRASIDETKDGKDFNLLAWAENVREPRPLPAFSAPNSKLLDMWLAKGRSKKEFDRRMKRRAPLSGYAEELLEKAKVKVDDGNRAFFEIASGFLSEDRFHGILAEAKGDTLEGDPGKNPTGRLIHRLMKAIEG